MRHQNSRGVLRDARYLSQLIPIPINNGAEKYYYYRKHTWPCLSEQGCLERFAGAISFRTLNFGIGIIKNQPGA